MEWLSNPANFFMAFGLTMIVVEVAVMQLSTFWFLYIGLGALFAALVLWVAPGLGWMGGMACFVVSTVIITVLINKPLRQWQKKPGAIAGNDAVGQSVDVLQDISADKPGKVSWSGSEWHAELVAGGPDIKAGERATIVSMHGITLVVENSQP